ncbi:MAG: hypothetical protein ACI4DU_07290 [Lachnospiraceae bacterium]
MKKVAMIEYQGRCDTEGNAVGHSPKVLKEYHDFIKDFCAVEIFAPEVIGRNLPDDIRKKCCPLPKNIVMKGHNSFFEKVNNKLHMFTNLKKAFAETDADIVWFFNVEYYLMLYLFFHKKPKQKVVLTMFLDGYHGNTVARFKQWVFEQAQKKMDLILASGEYFKFKNCKSHYIPDYYYNPEKYEKYRLQEKKEQAVCLGTMSSGKKLEELVEAFNQNGYSLIIAGRFYEKERFANLKKAAKQNITLRDCYLSEEEYYRLLSSSRYTVLPYGEDVYGTQTSGVMQEAMFLDVIPVANAKVLKAGSIPGVAFADYAELEKMDFSASLESYYRDYEKLRSQKYHWKKIQADYREIFQD